MFSTTLISSSDNLTRNHLSQGEFVSSSNPFTSENRR